MSKRGQRKQITQGDPDPMDDDSGGEDEQKGTFQRADESVIKQRRIVTARRRGGGGPAAAEAPKEETGAPAAVTWDMSSFAPPTGFGSEPAPSWGAPSSEAPISFGGDYGGQEQAVSFGGGFGTAGAEAFSFGPAGGDSGGGGGGGFSFGGGFGEATGSGDTGFSAVTFGASENSGAFSFGGGEQKKKKSQEGGEDEEDGEGGGENPEEETGFAPMAGGPAVHVEEVAVQTGEEGERQAFPATRAKLLQFEGGRWAERGMGKLSVNVLTSDETKARVLFRAEQVGTIRLNAPVFADMKPELMTEKSVKFLGVSDGKLAPFCVRFGKPAEAQSLVDELKNQIGKQGKRPGNAASAAPAPTPAPAGAEAVPKRAKAEPKAAEPKAAEPAPVAQQIRPAPTGKKQASASTPAPPAAAKAAEPDKTVAVCVVEEQQIAGVVTLSRDSPSAVLVEVTLEGLAPERTYAVEVDGASVAQLTGRQGQERVSVAARFASDSPIASFAGKRLSLSDGSNKIVRPIKLDL